MPKLVVIQGPARGLEYQIRNDTILGRDPRSQVIIAHREVSAQHARITEVGERFFIEDLGSRNGTFLNAHPVLRHPLKDGDEITIGRTVFRFEGALLPRAHSVRETPAAGSRTVDLDAISDVFQIQQRPAGNPGSNTADVLKLLCDISRSVGALAGLKTTLDEIAEILLKVFPQAGRVIIFLSPDGNSVEPVVTRRHSENLQPGSTYSDTVVRRALTERKAILTVDALSDDRFSSSRSVADLRLRALMCVPLLHREQVLGVVQLDTLDHRRLFTEADLNVLTGVVAQVAFAVANAQLYDELAGLGAAVVSSLTTALRLRSAECMAHAERVSRYATLIARRLELSPLEVETLRSASLLHDIGLLTSAIETHVTEQRWVWDSSVPDAGEGDQDPLRLHVERGMEVLSPLKPLHAVAALVQAHHERFDGRGVPRGLAGAEIPLGARILAVANAYDILGQAQSTGRGGPDPALEQLRRLAGSVLDPELVDVFERSLRARVRLEARRDQSDETPR